jgi:uncharacterized protein (DUF2267 family)
MALMAPDQTTDLQDAVFGVFGVALGTSAATYAASAPLPARLALVRALLPPGWVAEPGPALRERERQSREFMAREAGYHVD